MRTLLGSVSAFRGSIPTWSPGGEVSGDPQTGWMKEGILEQRGCSFQVDKFQQLSTIQVLCQMWACLN